MKKPHVAFKKTTTASLKKMQLEKYMRDSKTSTASMGVFDKPLENDVKMNKNIKRKVIIS